ncbi:MAG: PadR family transcriptional regulator [Holophagales bacterium]|nr:MAG: PadR family transcriptional regulator [Holophagales bacterium]
MPRLQGDATTLEFALLGLLDQQPQTGYDLRRVFATTPFALYSDSPGAVYPALRRLEARGWIAPVAVRPTNARGRRPLQLTALGSRCFRAWLEQPPTRDEAVRDLGALYLRFAFMSQAAPPAVPVRFLASLRELLAAHLEGLERFYAGAKPAMPPTGRLVFEHGMDEIRRTALWCERSGMALSAGESGRRKEGEES